MTDYATARHRLNWDLSSETFNVDEQLAVLEEFASEWGPATELEVHNRISRIKQHKLRTMLVPWNKDWAK